MKASSVPGKRTLSTSPIWTWIWPAWLWMDTDYWPSPGSWTLHKVCMLRPAIPFWSPVACTQRPEHWNVCWIVHDCMLLSWDLMPDDCDGVAFISPRCLGTMKTSLRFAKPLPTTTTLIAYAQYENLVVADACRKVIFDFNTWCSPGNFRRP